MEFSLMTEPQLGGAYTDLVEAARWAQDKGMASFARSDHYYWSGDPRATTDAMVSLGGLARETGSIRLCVLVTPITFRHPAVIAKSAATVDEMSGGRLDLGVGTGWMDLEHEAFGLPFPDWPERFERLTEALGYLRAAFTGERFEGNHYHLDAEALPRPSGLRLIVGGTGKHKTPTLAGEFADEYNHFATDPDEIRPKLDVVRSSAEKNGRDPDEILCSMMGPVVIGSDEAEYHELLKRRASERNTDASDIEERLRSAGVPHGPADKVAETFHRLESIGIGRYYLQWVDLSDMDGLDRTWSTLRDAL